MRPTTEEFVKAITPSTKKHWRIDARENFALAERVKLARESFGTLGVSREFNDKRISEDECQHRVGRFDWQYGFI